MCESIVYKICISLKKEVGIITPLLQKTHSISKISESSYKLIFHLSYDKGY